MKRVKHGNIFSMTNVATPFRVRSCGAQAEACGYKQNAQKVLPGFEPCQYFFYPFIFGLVPMVSLVLFLLLCSPVFSQEISPQKVQGELVRVAQKVNPAFVSVGGGSGVIISSDGYILTNHHVTRGIPKWLVISPGGVVHRADLVGYDSIGDIALLKILKGKNLPYVELGDSDKIQPGQAIFALGNPWGLAGPEGHPTLTFGIISAINRFQGGYGDCFQIDAPINPGNSGGPTFDFQGRLLGINGQIRPRFGRRTFSGVGLAIPINQIKNFLPLLKKGGEVGHGILPKGLKFAPAPRQMAVWKWKRNPWTRRES